MRSLFIILSLSLTVFSSCQKNLFKAAVQSCESDHIVNPEHPMKDSIRSIVDRYISKGLPGIQVAVKNADGMHITMGGYAAIETSTPYEPCSTGWLFSITKTYTAALVMKSKEQGLIDLDKPIAQYLPKPFADAVTGSDKITVRMLLNHTSGIVNFTKLPAYQLEQFNNPLKQPSIPAIIKLIEGHPLDFEPGQDFSYSNSNYMLLHPILEKVTGKSYEALLEQWIFRPLDLQHTYYKPNDQQISSLGFPNYYFDRYANENLENITGWNNALGRACASWGGVAATAPDAIRFYESLIGGGLLQPASLEEMKTWIKGAHSSQPDYGLGFEYYQYAPGSTPQFGHEGDGIGNSTMMMYVPDNHTFLFINTTVGRQLFGPYLFKITDMKNDLARYVANWRP